MSEIAGVVLAMIWMGLGGFAFAKMPDDGKKLPAEAVVFAFFICLAFGPAMFGYWLATRKPEAPSTPDTLGDAQT